MPGPLLRRSFLARLACVLLAAAAPGCASPLLTHWFGPELPAADARHPVSRVVCIWEPSEGQGIDGLPTRGFAGQILFFTRGTSVPVTVDGDVRVYLFDDRGTPQEQAKPIHQFDFLGDAWSIHLQKTNLGAAYSVFVPYVRKDPWQAHCTLRIRFTPKDGAAVYSETARVTLPGPVPKSDAPATAATRPDVAAPAAKATVAHRRGTGNELADSDDVSGAVPGVPARTDDVDPRRAKQQDLERLIRELLAKGTAPSSLPAHVAAVATAVPIAHDISASGDGAGSFEAGSVHSPPAPPTRRHRLAPAAFDSPASSDVPTSTSSSQHPLAPDAAVGHPLGDGPRTQHPLSDVVP